MATIIVPITIRKDTYANWNTNNPIPREAEWTYETDFKRVKIGDGATAYNDLPYFNSGGGGSSTEYYPNEAALIAAHPTGIAGQFALVSGLTDVTIWAWDPVAEEWVDTGNVVSFVLDDALDPTSENGLKNKRIAEEFAKYLKTDGTISKAQVTGLVEELLTKLEEGDIYNIISPMLEQGFGISIQKTGTKFKFINTNPENGENTNWGFVGGDIALQADLQAALSERGTIATYQEIPYSSEIEIDCEDVSPVKVRVTNVTGNLEITDIFSSLNKSVELTIVFELSGISSAIVTVPSYVTEGGAALTGNQFTIDGAVGEHITVAFEKRGSNWELFRNKGGEEGVSSFADLEGAARDNADLAAELDAAEQNAKDYADSVVDAAVVGLYDDRGNYDASGNVFPSLGGSGESGAILKGDIWTISAAGTLGGTTVIPGQTVRALVDTPGATSSNWAISVGTSSVTNTDAVSEGSTNKYFTAARVLATVLTGFSTLVGGTVVSTDTVLEAFGKIQKQINEILDFVNSFSLNAAYTSTVLFDKLDSWHAEYTMSDDINFSLAGSGHLARRCMKTYTITADGVHKIFFGPNFVVKAGIESGDVLTTGTYRIHMLWNGINEVDVSVPNALVVPIDTVPPTVSSVSMSDTWAYISKINYTLSEAATLFWAAYPSGDSQHTVSEIEAGTGAAAYGSYTSASGSQAIILNGLTPGTSYKIHYFAKDTALNSSASAMTSTITTMSSINYAALGSVQLILDDAGLAINTTNSYGTVDVSGNVTQWNSLAPGPTGRNFAVNGTGVTLASGVNFGGSGSLRCTDRASFKFLHYNASGLGSLKWTIHAVVKFADLSDPNYSVMLLGNNGTSSANIGVQIGYADNGSNADNALTVLISNGGNVVHRSFVVGSPDVYNNSVITPNQMLVFSLDFDGSRSVTNRLTLKINGLTQNLSSQSTASSSLNSGNSTYDLELSAGGNAALRSKSVIRTLILQDTVDSGSTSNYFIRELMGKYAL